MEGQILDIGGGGEGIIGQVNGGSVISIDLSKEELEESPSKNPKVVMDARKLAFDKDSFEFATAFFSLMYVDRDDRKRVFNEIHRVLEPGGKFVIWDVKIMKYDGGKRDIFVVPVTVKLSNKVIETGYGVLWTGKKQDIKYYLELADETGFKVEEKSMSGKSFHLILKKSISD